MLTIPRSDVERILKATCYVEHMLRNPQRPQGRWTGGKGTQLCLGKLDGELTTGGSATVSVWNGKDTLADSGRNVTAYDWFLDTGDSLASGTKVVMAFICGKWYVIGAAC